MTLGDAMALVMGVALAFAAYRGRGVIAFFGVPAWAFLVFSLIDLTRGLSLAVSLVVLARLARYRRMPRPSEWLAILVAASMLASRQDLNVDGFVNRIYATFPSQGRSAIDFVGWRWAIAGLESVAILAGLATLRVARRRLPRWSKALILAGLATLAISGPLAVFGLQGADLISPSGGFGPGVGPILLRKTCWLAAQIPLGLLFGIPAFGALAERIGGRRWGWTEWAGASLSLAVGILFVIFDRSEFPIPSWGWLIELATDLIWLIVVLFLSRSAAIRLGPIWRRWIGGADDQPGRSTSDEASPASHF